VADVKLLTAEEVKAMRRELISGDFDNPECDKSQALVIMDARKYERIVATLEALMAERERSRAWFKAMAIAQQEAGTWEPCPK
jgi:hypothetical protein